MFTFGQRRRGRIRGEAYIFQLVAVKNAECYIVDITIKRRIRARSTAIYGQDSFTA